MVVGESRTGSSKFHHISLLLFSPSTDGGFYAFMGFVRFFAAWILILKWHGV